jgi:hypothetical protein
MPMKNLLIHYPWKGLERGQGFFVPCLDTDAVRRQGLNEALKLRLFRAKAQACIMGGLLGVWFYLPAA